MLKVGLTGGIGSGKSMVAKLFEVLNIPIYYADIQAKILMNKNDELISQIKVLLGEESYKRGQLNRAWVAQQVFNHKDLLEQLNQIVHPAVKTDFEIWSANQANAKFVVQEAAVLFENDGYKKFDHMVLVTAPLEVRVARVMQRDQVSEEKVMERILNQWSDEQKIPLADTIIINDDKHSVIDQTLKFIKKL